MALFHCSAETCSVEGPNQEQLKKSPCLFSSAQNHKLHELTSSMKEKAETLLVAWLTEAALCLGTGEKPAEKFWVRI